MRSHIFKNNLFFKIMAAKKKAAKKVVKKVAKKAVKKVAKKAKKGKK